MNTQNITNFINRNSAILMIALVLSSAIAYRYFTAPSPRFCEEKNRVLTNEELIIAALGHEYQLKTIKIDDSI
jgi:hypothetical protein